MQTQIPEGKSLRMSHRALQSLWRRLDSDWVLLFLFYCALVVVKLLWIRGVDGPIVSGDEFLYKDLAQSIFSGLGYFVHNTGYNVAYLMYPPLYPLILTPAFLFGDDWYAWMLRINVLVSSCLIFPVWAIARSLLPRQESWASVLVAAIIPYNVVFPRLIMSENLFLPLFITAFYLTLRDKDEGTLLPNLVTGAVWGLSYLTRHIFLAVIPVLFILWWIKPKVLEEKHFSDLFHRSRFFAAVFILLGFVLVYAPWVLYSLGNSVDPLSAIGINTVSQPQRLANAEQTLGPINDFAVWLIFYTAYVLLMSTPYLTFLAAYAWGVVERPERRSLFFVIAFASIMGVFLIIAAFFISRSFGDGWTDFFVEGRYVMYGVPLLPIVAFVVADRLRSIQVGARLRAIVIGWAISLILVCTSYFVLIGHGIWQLSPWFTSIDVVNFDVLGFNESTIFPLGVSLLALGILVGNVQSAFVLLPNRMTSFVLLIGFLLFNFGNISPCIENMERDQEVSRHGRVLAQVLLSQGSYGYGSDKYPINVILDDSSLSLGSYTLALLFWGVPKDRYVVYKLSPIGEQDNVPSWLINAAENFRSVHSAKDLPASGLVVTTKKYSNPVATYQVQGTIYNAYQLPVSSENATR